MSHVRIYPWLQLPMMSMETASQSSTVSRMPIMAMSPQWITDPEMQDLISNAVVLLSRVSMPKGLFWWCILMMTKATLPTMQDIKWTNGNITLLNMIITLQVEWPRTKIKLEELKIGRKTVCSLTEASNTHWKHFLGLYINIIEIGQIQEIFQKKKMLM